MLQFINRILALTPAEHITLARNSQISTQLKALAESNDFSKIKMSFNDKCPRAVEKCHATSCSVPKMSVQGEDGYIDLLSVREAYSPTAAGSAVVWNEIYALVNSNEVLRKVVSGLHFSVTTHLSAFHYRIFNYYFSNPLIFQRRFNQEYKDNFIFLFSLIRAAVANLTNSPGEIPKEVLSLSLLIQKTVLKEKMQIRSNFVSENGASNTDNKQSFNELMQNINAMEQFGLQENFKYLFGDIPNIDKSAIEVTNAIVRQIACLNCEKCKLWGTIQVKGIKAAIKSLNGMPLYPNEVIFLINAFRRLSVSVTESDRLQNVRMPYLCLIILCHKQILSILMMVLIVLLAYLKRRRTKKVKLE